MNDWAEKMAYGLHMSACYYDYSDKQCVEAIAAALRTARSIALEEAANTVGHRGQKSGTD